MGLGRWAMMETTRSGIASVVAGVIALAVIAGCISPGSDDPFDGYYPHLKIGPDYFVRVATVYDPAFTAEEARDAAEHYGLYPGSPANVGRWAALHIVVYGDGNGGSGNPDGQESDDNASSGDEGPLCDQVETGNHLVVDPETERIRNCVSLDEDEYARTHFFLPEGSSFEIGFGFQGSVTERAADDREDCRGSMY